MDTAEEMGMQVGLKVQMFRRRAIESAKSFFHMSRLKRSGCIDEASDVGLVDLIVLERVGEVALDLPVLASNVLLILSNTRKICAVDMINTQFALERGQNIQLVAHEMHIGGECATDD